MSPRWCPPSTSSRRRMTTGARRGAAPGQRACLSSVRVSTMHCLCIARSQWVRAELLERAGVQRFSRVQSVSWAECWACEGAAGAAWRLGCA